MILAQHLADMLINYVDRDIFVTKQSLMEYIEHESAVYNDMDHDE